LSIININRVVSQFVKVQPKAQAIRNDGRKSKEAFHNLSSGEYSQVIDLLNIESWGEECQKYNLSAGQCFAVACFDSHEVEMNPMVLGGFVG